MTRRERTSPSTWRWQQHAAWTGGVGVVNVAMHPWVWSYLADRQVKLTRSYRREHWTATGDGPHREADTRAALAEATALVAHGRSAEGRRALAAVVRSESAMKEPWQRGIVRRLNA